jgi:uncharacterized protein
LPFRHLAARSWRPTPLREFVFKVRQRCNIACQYCYVYEMADQSWRSKPQKMSRAVVAAAVERIVQHVERHDLKRIAVAFHGGEPLLAPVTELGEIAAAVRESVPPTTQVTLSLQSNGLLVSERVLRALLEHTIRLGVSLDGGRAGHGRFRRGIRGESTFDQARRGLRLLGGEEFQPIYAGILCVVDVHSDPIDTYESLLSFRPPAVDFLLPHANWSTAPRADVPLAAYGEWLVRVFDRWYGAEVQETRIRLFEELLQLILGGPSASEQIGLSPVAVAVIETDGTIEQSDSLKSAYDGAAATGLSVFHDSFDRVLEHPGFVARQIGLAALSDTCLSCDVVKACGGGMYAHRYRAGTGFRNPSRYCEDLRALVTHARSRVSADMARLR